MCTKFYSPYPIDSVSLSCLQGLITMLSVYLDLWPLTLESNTFCPLIMVSTHINFDSPNPNISALILFTRFNNNDKYMYCKIHVTGFKREITLAICDIDLRPLILKSNNCLPLVIASIYAKFDSQNPNDSVYLVYKVYQQYLTRDQVFKREITLAIWDLDLRPLTWKSNRCPPSCHKKYVYQVWWS